MIPKGLSYNTFIHLKFRFNQTISIAFTFINNIYLFCFCVIEYEEIMSQKFHLYAGIFRIHWLDAEAFRTDNLYFFIFLVIFVQICFLEVSRLLLSVYDFILVFTKLTLDNLLYQVN